MSVAYVRVLSTAGEYSLVEIIPMGAGSPPDRPEQKPPLGIWGPTDPRPTHPIAGIPGFPGYTPPGSGGGGGPVDPGYSPPWAQVPGGGGGMPEVPAGSVGAVLSPVPPPAEGQPVPQPPAGMPAGSVQVMITVKGQTPAKAWVEPSISGGPL